MENKGDHCMHGNPWNDGDPVDNKWIVHAGSNVVIYKQNFITHGKMRIVFYRPTIGGCACQYCNDG